MIKLPPDWHSRTTPHTSPLRASYGVYFVSYMKKNYRDISIAQCITQTSGETVIDKTRVANGERNENEKQYLHQNITLDVYLTRI